ncbi:MAG TPA: hypothetical protein VN445_00855 [Rectinemataceae bacterium]|nr:hypothetical protein [Rectinemataceae bacterium]
MLKHDAGRGIEERRADFLHPDNRFRSLPFWAWNDRLSIPELERQILDLKEKGFGGFFIHSREGLETAYLGGEWMEAAKSAVRKALEVGIEAWIYDEDRWPSGFAGGRVPALGDAYRAKGLSIDLDAASIPPEALAAYALEIAQPSPGEADALISFRRLERGEELGLSPRERLAVLRRECSAGSDWFNGEAPPDTLNPDCVDAFIRETHEAYASALGGKPRGLVGGFFYDEPGAHDRHAAMTPGRGWVPWTDGFDAFYRERRGGDFLETAPLLFFDGAGDAATIAAASAGAAARHDYWRTLTERFSETFSGRIGDWCGRNGVESTGHFLWENDLGVATRVCGAIMPNYRHQDMPGIDILGLSDDEVMTVKQCASVANQLGKDRVISECYDATGWNFGGDDQKWQGDWQYALGVTLRCQHNVLYSLRGCRKRDYPPSFNYHNPAWPAIGDVEAYFARLSAALTGGLAVRDVLVVHPASTAWARLGSGPRGFAKRGLDRDIPGIKAYGEALNHLLRKLVEAHRDCDLGDEGIMADEARVVAGSPSASLAIGRAMYKIVVLPNLDTLLATTFALLVEFATQGGKIIVLGPAPAMIEGRISAEAHSFFSSESIRHAPDAHALFSALDELLPRALSVRDEAGAQVGNIWCMLKDIGDARLLFAINRDREAAVRAMVSVATPTAISAAFNSGRAVGCPPEGWAMEEWDPYTGLTTSFGAESPEPGILHFSLSLGPSGSRIFLIGRERGHPSASSAAIPARSLRSDEIPAFGFETIPLLPADGLSQNVEIHPTMPNALVLDRARARVGTDGPWSSEMALWKAKTFVRAKLAMRPNWKNELPQRYTWVDRSHPRDGTKVSFLFRFEEARTNPLPLELATEAAADLSAILLNGATVPMSPDGWYLDRAMSRFRLPAPRPGLNELVLEFAYRESTEIEDCALVGDFGVDPERRVVEAPSGLRLGDWTKQNLFHYPGSVVYTFRAELDPGPDERWWVEAGDAAAVASFLSVNGARIGAFAWRDLRALEVTGALKRGANRVEIEVTGGARNFFGPLHLAGGEPSIVDWMAFRNEDSEKSALYSVAPRGLYSPPRLLRAKGKATGETETR